MKMTKIDISIFEKKAVFYITVLFGVLMALMVGVSSMLQERFGTQLESSYHQQMSRTIESLIAKYVADSDKHLGRLLEVADVNVYVASQDAQKLHGYFLPYWKYLQANETSITDIRFYTNEAALLLQMSGAPSSFDTADAFIRNVLSTQRKTNAFVHDASQSVYAVASPLFDDDGSVAGIIEMLFEFGLVIRDLEEITGQVGFLFVKEERMPKEKRGFAIGPYRVYGDKEMSKMGMLGHIDPSYRFEDNSPLQIDGREYRMHVFDVPDLYIKERAKLLFFEDVSVFGHTWKNLLSYMLASAFLAFSVALLLVIRGSKGLKRSIDAFYDVHTATLKESEERFRRLYEHAPDAYQLLDSSGSIMMVNRQWAKLFGRPDTDAVIGEFFSDFLTPMRCAEFISAFPEFKRSGEIRGFDFELRREGDDRVSIRLDGNVVYDEGGRLMMIHCILFNVTSQIREEKRRKHDEAYLQGVFDGVPNMVITSRAGIIDRANRAMLEFTGYKTLEGFMQEHRCISELFVRREGYLAPEMSGENWLDHVGRFPAMVHKAVIDKAGREHVFVVQSLPLNIDGEIRSVTALSDVTGFETVNARLQEAQQIAHIGHYEVDHKSGMLMAGSDEAYKVLRIARDLKAWHAGEYVDTIVYPQDRKKTAGHFSASPEGGDFLDTYRVYDEREGHMHYIEVRGHHISGDDGSVEKTIGTVQDITEKMQADMERRKLDAAIAQSPLSIMITDHKGVIEFVNPWFCELTGYRSEEVIGKKPNILRPHDFDPEVYRELWREIAQKRIWTGTFKNISKTGKPFYESAIIAPIVDDDGNITNYIAVKQLITEQIELKEKLEREEKKTRQLGDVVEHSVNEIYIFDKESKCFLYLNQSALGNTGYDIDEVHTMTLAQIQPKMIPENFEQTAQPLLNGEKEAVFFSTVHRRKDETLYYVDVYLQLAEFEEKKAYIAIVTDVTEQVNIRKELKEKEELMIAQSRHAAMGEMIAMIAHQWRQPITAIGMSANNLLVDVELDTLDKEELTMLANEINDQTLYLSRTIDDFRDFFRPGKEKERISVCEVIDETIAIIGKSLENSGIRIEKEYADEGVVETYSRELLQVYVNIIKNAKEVLIERGVKEPLIRVKVYKSGDDVLTEICDNGGGIAMEIMIKIFEPYFSTKDERVGTGLGLYMCETIVQKHLGGVVDVENRDGGACFTVALPAYGETAGETGAE